MQVPFFKQNSINLQYESDFNKGIADFFDGSTYLVNGKNTKDFEKNFARFIGSNHFSFLSNGLDALTLALFALNIQPGDEVIVPSHTYIATWLAPLRLGCKLKIVPVDDKTFLMDASKLSDLITEKTKVVMPVHLYGNCCDISEIKKLQNQYNFKIVEDAAQAHGSMICGKKVGSLGDITCFSFYPTKNLGGIGEGGGISTNDVHLAAKINSLRNYGRSMTDGSLNMYCGFNNRGDEIQALFLNIKLKNIDQINAKRRDLVRIYNKVFSSSALSCNLIDYQSESCPHLAILKTNGLEERNNLITYLKKNDIQTSIHYRVPCHLQPFINIDSLMIADSDHLKQAEEIADSIISLPLSEAHTIDEIEYVAQLVNQFYQI